MPLNVETIDDDGRLIRRTVLQVLMRDGTLAFTVDELVAEVANFYVEASSVHVEAALDRLVSRGTVVIERVGHAVYFRYDDRFGLRPAR